MVRLSKQCKTRGACAFGAFLFSVLISDKPGAGAESRFRTSTMQGLYRVYIAVRLFRV